MNARPFLQLFFLCFLGLADLLNGLEIGGCWSPFTFALQRKAFIRDAVASGKCVIIQPTTILIEYGKKRAFCPSNVIDIAANRKILGLTSSDELIIKDHEDWNTFGIVQNVKCGTVDVGKCSRSARQARSIIATNSTLLNKLIRRDRSSGSSFDLALPFDSDDTLILDCSSAGDRNELSKEDLDFLNQLAADSVERSE